MLAKIKNGVVVNWPLSEYEIQGDYPKTSFSYPLNDDTLLKFGYARFVLTTPAEYDVEFQEAKELTPVLNGVVATQAWEIIEKYSDEEKNAFIIKRDADQLFEKSRAVRHHRNMLLYNCDWTQLADTPINKPIWLEYRQALRDISLQAGFPFKIEWPIKPE